MQSINDQRIAFYQVVVFLLQLHLPFSECHVATLLCSRQRVFIAIRTVVASERFTSYII